MQEDAESADAPSKDAAAASGDGDRDGDAEAAPESEQSSSHPEGADQQSGLSASGTQSAVRDAEGVMVSPKQWRKNTCSRMAQWM